MVFNSYAKYYNLLYKDKAYNNEVDYIHRLIKKFSVTPARTLLDIGCGTGTHASYFSQIGYEVWGVDLSEEMILQAQKKGIANTHFQVGNATGFTLNKHFDIVTSLFHVLSYQTSNRSVNAMIKNACAHLKVGGLFIFDFWYGPAVLSEKPSVKIRRLEDNDIKVTRLSEPVMHINDNIVDVNFEVLIHDKLTDRSETIKEVHPMRYFFKPEIEEYLDRAGMNLLYFNEWLSGNKPSSTTWGVCCVAVKNQ